MTPATLRVAAAQSAPVFLDREATVERALGLIEEARNRGAELLGFPEGYLPGHPGWVELLPFDERALELGRRLFEAAIEVPGPEIEAIGAACGEHGVGCVLGICERLPATKGTLFNTQVLIDREGRIAAKHQKLVPTIGERLVHAPGRTGTVNSMSFAADAVATGLICGENSNPLAQYATALAYPVAHVAAWPQHFSPAVSMPRAIEIVSRGLAYTLKCFVLNAVTLVGPEMVAAYGDGGEVDAFLSAESTGGRASIISPAGELVAAAEDAGEGLLVADIDPSQVVLLKQVHDFAGHYNRPEVFAPLVESAGVKSPSDS